MLRTFSYYILFTFLVALFSASAVGIMNSGDSPQYFTTKALLEHGDVNMAHYEDNPHYFVDPDVYYEGDETRSVRGYLFSLVTAPLHLVGNGLKHLVITDQFPEHIRTPEFPFELSVTMLFTIIPATGILLIFATLLRLTKSFFIAGLVSVLTACGTYVWKYSSYMTRQSVSVLILSAMMFGLYQLSTKLTKRKRIFTSACIGTIYGLTYGIDPILFIALTIYFLLLIGMNVIKKKWVINFPSFIIAGLICINLITIGNVYFYDTVGSTHVDRWQPIYDVLGDDTKSFMVSAPLIPVSTSALFSIGQLPKAAFKHFEAYPALNEVLNTHFPQTYNFYGLFIVSPYLLIGLFLIFMPEVLKKHRMLLSFCVIVFGLGIAGTSKIFGFWGGNQYDVRYFYPYVVLLSIPCALALQNLHLLAQSRGMKYLVGYIYIFSTFLICVSFFMGWLGVINMYLPAVTGERRIWLELHTLNTDIIKHTPKEYFNATFMNIHNAWLGAVIGVLTVFLSRLVLELLSYQHTRMSFKGWKRGKNK